MSDNKLPEIQITGTKSQSSFVDSLVKVKTGNGFKSPHFWIILALVGVYIFSSYVVFPTFYDVYVIFLFAPLIYAVLAFRLRGAIIGSIVFVGILVPKALPLSLTAPVFVRSFVFLVFPFLVSGLVALWLNYFERQMAAYREILALNVQLNSYVERLEKTQKQLLQVEKLHALGQLSAAIAHEINNPLAGVIMYTQLLQKKIKGETIKREESLEILAKMELALTQSAKLVRSLLDFARQSTPTLKSISIGSVIEQVIALVGHQAQLKKIKIVREEAPDLPPVKGDFSQLQQVFINLVVNGIQAMPEDGTLTIRTSSESFGNVKVSIQDTGVGIPPENMDKLFTPFFSTKEAVKGVGLGLAVSYGIVERHGGRIEVHSEVGKGSTFTVFLPVYREEAQTPGQPGPVTEQPNSAPSTKQSQ
ncbi:MAG TPA: ATP-binding protein [Dehalococcoidales bacterium]